MLEELFGFRFDYEEFAFGLAVGIVGGLVLGFFLGRLKPAFSQLKDWAREWIRQLGESLASRTVEQYQKELISRVETMHLARAIFALEEIMIPPRLLAPPIASDPMREEPKPESALDLLPNLPDWSYLSGVYSSPRLSLVEALSEGVNLLITGRLGSGKSAALAYLALQVVRREKEAAALSNRTPMLVHAADVKFENLDQKDPVEPLLQAAQHTASSALASTLPRYLRQHFRQGDVLLLLDGLDEFSEEEIQTVAAWLESLQETCPGILIAAAGPPEGYDGLARIGFRPISIAPWTDQDQRAFLTLWGRAWRSYVVPTLPKDNLGELDPALINGWLIGMVRGLSPLELTLLAWAAFAGDIRGPRAVELLQAYVARFLSPDEGEKAQTFALDWVKARRRSISERALPRGIPIGDLLEASILVRRADGMLTFNDPAVGAHLAASAMARSELNPEVIKPGWLPAETTMTYFAALRDLSDVVQDALRSTEDPLHRNAFRIARWMRDAPKDAEWKPLALRALAKLLQDSNLAYGLRLRALHALVQSAESSVAVLFRRLLTSQDPKGRALAALGLGGMSDEDSIQSLIQTVESDPDLNARQAACLAFAAIGSDRAFDGLGNVLVAGEEALRLAAAEALAVNPDKGYSLLREAADYDDLLTRRAAVFGLARVPEEWAVEKLLQIQTEDSQWIVRGAATEVNERRMDSPWKILPMETALSEIPWLIAFAARAGMGVAPGRAALEMIRRALNQGTPEEKVAALETLGWRGGEELILDIFQALQSQEAFLRDAAYETLWCLAASGHPIPSLSQPPQREPNMQKAPQKPAQSQPHPTQDDQAST